MKALLLALLWVGVCLAQVVTGVVERVAADRLELRGGREFLIDSKTEIYGQPRPGSIVRIRHEGSQASVVAVRTTIRGDISDLTDGRWFVVEGRTVYILRDTRFGTSARQLRFGQTVEATGWLNSKGDVEAEQVILYNTDLPVQRFRSR